VRLGIEYKGAWPPSVAMDVIQSLCSPSDMWRACFLRAETDRYILLSQSGQEAFECGARCVTLNTAEILTEEEQPQPQPQQPLLRSGQSASASQ
jgi:hypothetical protein